MSRTTVIASNRTPYTATLCWCSEGTETAYGQPLAPGEVRMQETFVGHCWRLHCEGGSVEHVATVSEHKLTLESAAPAPEPAPEAIAHEAEAETAAAFYKQSAEVGCAGLTVRASDVVASGAVLAAAAIAREMLRHSPEALTSRLAVQRCSISVIGREQLTSDIPEHRAHALSAQRTREPAPEAPDSRDPPKSADDIRREAMAAAIKPRLERCDTRQLAGVRLCACVSRQPQPENALQPDP